MQQFAGLLQDDFLQGSTPLRQGVVASTVVSNDDTGSVVTLLDSSFGSSCGYNPNARSMILKSRLLEQLSASPDIAEREKQRASFLQPDPTEPAHLTNFQPFVVAGDMLLTKNCADREDRLRCEDPASGPSINVVRLQGSEYQAFSLENLQSSIPVSPRPETLSATDEALRPGMVTLPPPFVSTNRGHNPGVQTASALFYAVNPDLESMECLARYCGSADTGSYSQNCLQYMFASNYDRIRLWRINPFLQCQDSPISGRTECPENIAQAIEFNSTMNKPMMGAGQYASCSEEMDLLVESMSYFDERNIAVTVIRGTIGDLYNDGLVFTKPATDTTSASAGDRGAYTKTAFYFIDTVGNRVREGIPWPAESAPQAPGSLSGALCPEVARLARNRARCLHPTANRKHPPPVLPKRTQCRCRSSRTALTQTRLPDARLPAARVLRGRLCKRAHPLRPHDRQRLCHQLVQHRRRPAAPQERLHAPCVRTQRPRELRRGQLQLPRHVPGAARR